MSERIQNRKTEMEKTKIKKSEKEKEIQNLNMKIGEMKSIFFWVDAKKRLPFRSGEREREGGIRDKNIRSDNIRYRYKIR